MILNYDCMQICIVAVTLGLLFITINFNPKI
jgi:hypothetical protein